MKKLVLISVLLLTGCKTIPDNYFEVTPGNLSGFITYRMGYIGNSSEACECIAAMNLQDLYTDSSCVKTKRVLDEIQTIIDSFSPTELEPYFDFLKGPMSYFKYRKQQFQRAEERYKHDYSKTL